MIGLLGKLAYANLLNNRRLLFTLALADNSFFCNFYVFVPWQLTPFFLKSMVRIP